MATGGGGGSGHARSLRGLEQLDCRVTALLCEGQGQEAPCGLSLLKSIIPTAKAVKEQGFYFKLQSILFSKKLKISNE